MAGYVVLWKMTEKGRSNLKALVEGLKQRDERLKQIGGRRIGTWLLFGEYDGITIVDAPDDLTMAQLALTAAQDGLTHSMTLRALSEDEVMQVVGKMG